MNWAKWMLLVGGVWFFSKAIFAQSLLSQPQWVENHTPTAPADGHSFNPLDTNALREEGSKEDSQATLFPPPHPESSQKLLPSENMVFESISQKAQELPQQALADLEAQRPFLEPEEARILEIQIIFNSQQYGQAEVLAEDFLDSFPESIFAPFAYFYNQKARFLLQKPLARDAPFNDQVLLQLPPPFGVDFLHILGEDARRQGNLLAAVGYFLKQRERALPPERVSDEAILQLLREIEQIEMLEAVEQAYEDVDFIQEKLPQLRLDLLVKQFQYAPALELIQALLNAPEVQENPEQADSLRGLQEQINVKLHVNPRHVGVILPLSSTNPQIARLTQETLEGLRLGLLSQTTNSQRVPLELILRDSQINAEASTAAVQELVEEEQVIAIIGPLIRQTSEAAAQEAQRLQVPLISLSLTNTIPDIGSYVFRNNQSWEQEMQALARYAFYYKNAKRFLILHPNTREGKNKMSFFWQEILRLGGTIQGVEGFDLGQKDFVEPFEMFTGLDRYTPDELKWMEDLEEPLEPLHEFDALLIPVGSRAATDLKAILPYAEAFEIKDILLFGDSGWNDYSVMLDLQKHGNDSVFIDSFFKQSPQSQVQKFIRLHERYFLKSLNYPGPTSYTAFAYDTVNLLSKTIASLQQPTHQQLQQALLHMKPYAGVTGVMTFLMNGEAQREMEILTIKAGEIVSVH